MLGHYTLCLLTLIFWTFHLTEGACPEGWDSVGPGCYKFTQSTSGQDVMSYPDAVSACWDHNKSVPIVLNDEYEKGFVGNSGYVQTYIYGKLGTIYPFWVGCPDLLQEGIFVCIDATLLENDSGLWKTGNPKSAAPGGDPADCVYYTPNIALEDADCNFEAFAICEVPPLAEPTTDPPQTESPTTSLPFQQANDRQKSGFYSMALDNNGNPLIGHCLTDHVMKSLPIKSKVRCAAECQREPGCKSFNFKEGVCELNAESKDSVGASYFSQFAGCLYFEPI